MAQLDLESPTQYLYMRERDFIEMNNAPLRAWHETLEEIAIDNPINAFGLVLRYLTHYQEVMPRCEVQTEYGMVTSRLDGEEAARGLFLKTLRDNYTGSSVIDPMIIMISVLLDQPKHTNRQMDHYNRFVIPRFSIAVEPLNLAT